MIGFFFQYGTAFHLALLTVAPLFLYSICPPWTSFVALTALSVFGVLWILMNPSTRFGEWPRDARARIGGEVFHDPFLFVAIAAVVIMLVRAVNGGVELAYDTADGIWRLTGPVISLLPGSVSGAGARPLAAGLSLFVVMLGVRHALGGRARFAYLFLSGMLAALTVAFWFALGARGIVIEGLARVSENPVFLGSVLGVFFLFAVIAWIVSWTQNSVILEMLSAVWVAGLLFGQICFAPVASVWTFCSLALVLLALGVWLAGFRRTPRSWFRFAVGFLIAIAPVGLTLLDPSARAAFWPVFPADFFEVREAASSVALAAWRNSSRLGTGLGAFPLALQFFATPTDWQVLSSFQKAVPNGWIQFLMERGFLGCAVLALAVFFLAKDAVLRFVRAPRGWQCSVVHFAGLAVLAGVVAVTFVESTFVQIEFLAPLGAAVALTTAALPERKES